MQADAVGIGGQVEVVAYVHGMHQETQLLRQLFAHALDATEQIATLVAINQGNEPVAHLQADFIHLCHIIPAELSIFRAALGPRRLGFHWAHLL